jgi:thiol:disulfide interchange protein DsbD
MGAISALIVGPCVAAPLAGALVYISQTRNVVIGGSALFSLAIGMSLPLLAIGLSAGSLLPRAGAWMDSVKRFFGVLMLALALWIASPILPSWTQFAGWSLLGLAYGIYLLRRRGAGWPGRLVAVLSLAFGLIQMAGLATGARDPLDPLAAVFGRSTAGPNFVRVKNVAELDAALAKAGKPTLLDFYADWCVSCKEMEKLTFSDSRVRARFNDMQLLQADVTANSADDKALLKRFHLFGPPGIIFFDAQGREVERGHVIGFQSAERFLQSLERVPPT